MRHTLIVIVYLLALAIPVAAASPDPLTSPLPTPDQHAYSAPATDTSVVTLAPLLPETGSVPWWVDSLFIVVGVVMLEAVCDVIVHNLRHKEKHDQTRTK